MALTVAQVLKLRDAGATRVVCRGDDLEVEFDAPPRRDRVSTPVGRVRHAPPYNHTRGDSPLTPCPLCAPAGHDHDQDPEPDVELPPRPRDALEVAQEFNGPIPYAEDA